MHSRFFSSKVWHIATGTSNQELAVQQPAVASSCRMAPRHGQIRTPIRTHRHAMDQRPKGPKKSNSRSKRILPLGSCPENYPRQLTLGMFRVKPRPGQLHSPPRFCGCPQKCRAKCQASRVPRASRYSLRAWLCSNCRRTHPCACGLWKHGSHMRS